MSPDWLGARLNLERSTEPVHFTPTMQILLTNDDGASSVGIMTLAKVASKLGRVVICAPEHEKSASSHGMTLRDPLRVKRLPVDGEYEAYAVDGLPVDSVNLALTEFFPDGCDLVLSGINNGPNLGWDITYSGTVGGALEGAINGIRSIAISVAKFVEGAPAHFECAERWLEQWLGRLIEMPVGDNSMLNVNVPSIAWPEIKGTKITRMGMKIFEDRVEKRSDPWGRPYYWQGGVVVMDSTQEGTDVRAVNEGYVSITPIRLDWTDTGSIAALETSLKAQEQTVRR